jgi:hypothetical protein
LTGNFSQTVIEGFVEDVIKEVLDFSKSQGNRFKPNKTNWTSEGGIIAPMVAVKSPDVAFIVLTASSGMLGEELLYAQSDRIARTKGASNETIVLEQRSYGKNVFCVKRRRNNAIVEENLCDIFGSRTGKSERAGKKKFMVLRLLLMSK